MRLPVLISKAVRLRHFRAASIGGLAGVCLTVLTGILLTRPIGGALAQLSYDLPFPFQTGIPSEIVMVYIDAKAKRNLQQPTDRPLDRHFHATLLDRLRDDGAKLVFYDLLFDEPSSDPSADQEFASAIRRNGHVVLVADYAEQLQRSNFHFDEPIPPLPALREAAAGWGLARITLDADHVVRRIDTGIENCPSATWVAATLLGAEVTKSAQNRFEWRWLNYPGSPHEFRAVDFDQAISRSLASGYFREKIVVVGARPEVGVQGDQPEAFRNPYSTFDRPLATGAAIHATGLLNLVRGDWLNRLNPRNELGIIVVWGAVVSVLLMLLRPWYAIGAAILLAALLTGFSMLLPIKQHVWYAWTIPVMAQTPVALIWGVGYQYIVEARRRRHIRRAFALYLSPYMADRIADRDFDLSLGGKEVEATVMFTDLAGFTAMSEPLAPTEVSRMLTSYFTRTSKAIKELNGTLIKYLGDGVMAGWGAPEPDPQHAEHTVLAALSIVQAGKEQRDAPLLRTRIGINTGIFLAGNLGSEDRFDYTLFGDATNFASRLEGLNKHLGTDILISEATFRQLKDGIQTRALGRFIVVGTSKPAAVYEVLGRKDAFQPPPSWLESFARGLEHFVKRELDAAEKMFRQTVELRGGKDGPSQFYLQRIERERAKPDTSVWDGTVRLQEK
jgi:adenylate cyclase